MNCRLTFADIQNLQTYVHKLGYRRIIQVQVIGYYAGIAYSFVVDIDEKSLTQRTLSLDAILKAAELECKHKMLERIEQTVGLFRIALRKAVQLVDEGHYVPELTEK